MNNSNLHLADNKIEAMRIKLELLRITVYGWLSKNRLRRESIFNIWQSNARKDLRLGTRFKRNSTFANKYIKIYWRWSEIPIQSKLMRRRPHRSVKFLVASPTIETFRLVKVSKSKGPSLKCNKN